VYHGKQDGPICILSCCLSTALMVAVLSMSCVILIEPDGWVQKSVNTVGFVDRARQTFLTGHRWLGDGKKSSTPVAVGGATLSIQESSRCRCVSHCKMKPRSQISSADSFHRIGRRLSDIRYAGGIILDGMLPFRLCRQLPIARSPKRWSMDSYLSMNLAEFDLVTTPR